MNIQNLQQKKWYAYILVTANITAPRTVAAADNDPFQRN